MENDNFLIVPSTLPIQVFRLALQASDPFTQKSRRAWLDWTIYLRSGTVPVYVQRFLSRSHDQVVWSDRVVPMVRPERPSAKIIPLKPW